MTVTSLRYVTAEALRWVAQRISPTTHIPYGNIEFAQARYVAALNRMTCTYAQLQDATRSRADDME